MYQQDLKLV